MPYLSLGNDGTDKRFLDLMAKKLGFKYMMKFPQGWDSAVRLVRIHGSYIIIRHHIILTHFSPMNGKLIYPLLVSNSGQTCTS